MSLTCDAPSAAQVDASIAAALAPYNLQADHDADVASLQTQIDNKQATLLNNSGEGLTLLQGGQLRRIIAEDGLSASIDTSRDWNLVLSGAALQADIATLAADLASASANATQNGYSIAQLQNRTEYEITRIFSLSPNGETISLTVEFTAGAMRIDKPLTLTADLTAPNVYSKTEVDGLLAALVNGAPAALDTLNELAAALGDDTNFATTITNALAGKQAILTSQTGSGVSLFHNSSVMRRLVTEGGLTVEVPINMADPSDPRNFNIVVSGAALQSAITAAQADVAAASASITQHGYSIAQLQNRTEYEITQIFSLSPNGETISLTVEFTAGAMRIDKPLTLTADLTAPNVYNKTEVNGLVAGLQTSIVANTTAASVLSVDLAALQLQVSSGFLARYTKTEVDNLLNAGGISTVGGDGVSILQDSNTVRRITAADGLSATQSFNVNDGTTSVQLSGASLQSAITALETKSVYEVQSLQSLAADASTITSVEFPPGSCRFDVPVNVNSNLDVTGSLRADRGTYVPFEVAQNGAVYMRATDGTTLFSTWGDNHKVVETHVPFHVQVLRSRNEQSIQIKRTHNDTPMNLSDTGIQAFRTLQAPELQTGSLRVYEQTGLLNTGSIVHPSALQLAVSSQATPAASEVLLSMEPTSGVTAQVGLTVQGNAVVTGDLVVGGSFPKAAPTAFDGYNVAETTLSATNYNLVVVDIDTSRLSTPSGAFSLSGGVLTVNTAGLYSVGYRVSTYILSGNSRSITRAQLSLSGTEVPGTRGFMYNRQLNQSYGSCAATCILQLSVGDELRVGVTRTHGVDTIATVSQGCSLTLLAL